MRKLETTFFALFLGTFLFTQNPLVESITIEDGLSQGMIFDIIQDKEGFIWIATKDGLNRYDGKRFKYFNNDPFDPYSISGNTIQTLAEDADGRLWIGTENNGLNVFDKTSELFFNLKSGNSENSGFSHLNVKDVLITPDEKICAATEYGLNILTRRKKFPTVLTEAFNLKEYVEIENHVYENPEIENLHNYASILFYSSQNEMWVNGFGIILKWDFEAQKFEKLPEDERFINSWITNFGEDPKNRIWISQPDAYYRWGGAGTWEKLQTTVPFDASPGQFTIDTEGNLYGLAEQQILYKPKESDSIRILLDFEDGANIKRTVILKDRSDNLWMGTGGYGIRKYNTAKERFRHFQKGMSIGRVFQDTSNRIWLMFLDKGWFHVKYLDGKTGEMYPTPFSSKGVMDVIQLKDGSFWGLYNYKKERGSSLLVEMGEEEAKGKYFF